MEMIKKYKVLLSLSVIVLGGLVFFFYRMYQHDIKLLVQFSASYKRSEKSISSFSILLFATNLNDTSGLNQTNIIYSIITNSMKDTPSDKSRSTMVKEVKYRSTHLLNELNNTDDLESKASFAIMELNSNVAALSGVSSLIRNDTELWKAAIEMADLSIKELDNLKAYKKEIRDKIDEVTKLLENPAKYSQKSSGYNNPLNQQLKIERLSDGFVDIHKNKEKVYVRFEKLAG